MADKIILTGGGTAGHVMPNIALLPHLLKNGFEVHYIGTENGIERTLISDCSGVIYHSISSGKLRRYFSWKNFTDPFRVIKGVFEAAQVVREVRPDVVFSKGGFVSVPVVLAASSKKVPVVTHESDFTPGLANKINSRFASKICVTFEDTLAHTQKKGVFTGTPIRPELLKGSRQAGLKFLGMSADKPLLLVMGGSLGAVAVNEAVRAALPELTKSFNVVHLCGKGKLVLELEAPAYKQFEFLGKELADVLAAADLVVSRAGANAVFELLALAIPALFIPLPLEASRGDQIQNSNYFVKKGYATMLEQEKLTPASLVCAIHDLYKNKDTYIAAMKAELCSDGTQAVLKEIMAAKATKK